MIRSTSPVSDLLQPGALVIRGCDFINWLEQARSGDCLEYHRGHLGADREPGSALPEGLRLELSWIADHAMELALEGRLHLVQERRGKETTAYLAVMGSAG